MPLHEHDVKIFVAIISIMMERVTTPQEYLKIVFV